MFSSFSSPKVSILSHTPLPTPRVFQERVPTLGTPAAVLSFTSAGAKTSTGLTSPARPEEKPVQAPTPPRASPLWPQLLALPAPSPALFLSEPQRQCPSEPLGTEACPPHWPRLPTLEHSGINGKQQDLSASPLSSRL